MRLSDGGLLLVLLEPKQNKGEARREKRADRLPRPTPGRSLRSIIPKNKRKLGFYRADCQSGLFSSRAFPPRKVPPVEYLRNLKFFHCATPSGRLRIHPYFGAAVVLGGVCSPCLSATRSTHHRRLKAKARQQGTSDARY
jgi:hypothetical protein